MQFTLTVTGDAQELAALLLQINQVPAKAVTASLPLSADLVTGGLAQVSGIVAQAQSNGTSNGLAVTEPVAEEAPAPAAEAPATKATRTRRSAPAVVVEAAPEAAAESVAKVVVDATQSGPGTTISHVPATLDHLRKVMQTKLAHQKQIIAWLEEFGAKNLSSLDAAHYEEMYSKLNSLA